MAPTPTLHSMLALLSALLLLLPSLALAGTTITFAIPPSTHLANPATLPASTHATLTTAGTTYRAPLSRAGRFTFRNIAPGSYLLDVYARDVAVAPLRVDVAPPAAEDAAAAPVEVWDTFRGNEWANKGERRTATGDDAVYDLRVTGPKDYYQARQGFSPMSLLKNPMVLIGVVSMVLVFGMPKLLDNMDPETRAEFEEQQRKGPLGGMTGQGGNALQNFDMAAWMAGKTSDSPAAASGADASASTTRRRG